MTRPDDRRAEPGGLAMPPAPLEPHLARESRGRRIRLARIEPE